MGTDLRPVKEFQIREEYGSRQLRLYGSTTIWCDIPAGVDGEWTFSKSFPIDISLYAAVTIVSAIMEGDEAELHVGDETTIGANTAQVDVGDDEITVNDTVIANAKIGYWCFIGSDDLGRILEIDEDAKTIKVENQTVSSFAPGVGAVSIQVKMGHELRFAGVGTLPFGQAMIGGSPVPKGTNIHVHYTNKEGSAKKMMLLLEYRY